MKNLYQRSKRKSQGHLTLPIISVCFTSSSTYLNLKFEMEYLNNHIDQSNLAMLIHKDKKTAVSVIHYLCDTHARSAKYLISCHVLCLAISLDLVLNKTRVRSRSEHKGSTRK